MRDTVTLSAPVLSAMVGVLMPLLVGIVTRRVTDSNVQRALLLALSTIGGALVEIGHAGGTFRLRETLLSVAVTYFTAQTAYSAVLKPIGAASAVASATSAFGLTLKRDPAKAEAVRESPVADCTDEPTPVVPDVDEAGRDEALRPGSRTLTGKPLVIPPRDSEPPDRSL